METPRRGADSGANQAWPLRAMESERALGLDGSWRAVARSMGELEGGLQMSAKWTTVNEDRPCEICRKADWCTCREDVAHCMRTTEAPEGWRLIKLCTHGAIFCPDIDKPESFSQAPNARLSWKVKAEGFQAALTTEKLNKLADNLGVTPASLREIGAGWNHHKHLYTFPERNGRLEIIGIGTRRLADGEKKCIKGSARGLVTSSTLDRSRLLLVAEGPSDTAAGLAVHLQVIGRPSACGGVEHLTELLEPWDGEVVILGENDRKETGDWPGRIGAIRVAAALARRMARPIRWSLPPREHKDLRAWIQAVLPESPSDEDRAVVGQMVREFLVSNSEICVDSPTQSSPNEGEDKPRKSQADKLVELVLGTKTVLFHTPGGADAKAMAIINCETHRETWPINSSGFRSWMAQLFFEKYEKSPSSEALASAINTLKGHALFRGSEREIGIRIAGTRDTVYVDLCDAKWQVVQITAVGWKIMENEQCPVRFIRRKGMLPLPQPERGGSVNKLRHLLNLPRDDDWRLFVAFLLICLHPRGPFTILCVNGLHGSAKSTLCRLARRLIDPNEAGLRRPPREERDLMIAANNSWLLAYSNLSSIPVWLSDGLCSIVYGEGGAVRLLYSDDDEILFNACRPVMVNGIEGLMTRPDFADRCIHLVLPPISDEKRRTDEEIDADFERVAPFVLGALYDAIAWALKNANAVKTPLLRMATATKWVAAAETSLGWDPGTFLNSFRKNRDGVHEDIVAGSEVAQAVVDFMANRPPWEGTATALFATLDAFVDPKIKRSPGWPKAPNSLAGKLKRLAPNLEAVGIEIDFPRSTDAGRTKLITLSRSSCDQGPSDGTPDDPDCNDRPEKIPYPNAKNAVPDDLNGSDGLFPCPSGAAVTTIPAPVGLPPKTEREEGEI